jgi:hypothetical protein
LNLRARDVVTVRQVAHEDEIQPSASVAAVGAEGAEEGIAGHETALYPLVPLIAS